MRWAHEICRMNETEDPSLSPSLNSSPPAEENIKHLQEILLDRQRQQDWTRRRNSLELRHQATESTNSLRLDLAGCDEQRWE